VIYSYLSTNGLNCHAGTISFRLISGFLAGGENFRAHVPAGLGPFVVLLGQDSADKADDGVTPGKDADDVGPPAYLLIEAFDGYLEPDGWAGL
jgi:hypothetical protein